MTRANTEQVKITFRGSQRPEPRAASFRLRASSTRHIFALKGGGYGCLFALSGIDEEGLTDQELESQLRSIEGALRGLPEGSCLYQYTRVMSGFDACPGSRAMRIQSRRCSWTTVCVSWKQTAGFRRIDLHWCLTLEPSKVKAFDRKPQENAAETSRMLAELEKTATLACRASRQHDRTCGCSTSKARFQFFSYLFNLEEWADQDQLRSDTGVDRQIVKNPVAWHSDHLRVGKRYVQMFSLKTTPEASRPCLFSDLLQARLR